MNILLIDDSKSVHNYIKDALKDGGHIFFSGFNGQEGLDIFMENSDKIDLIFLDWEMPIMDGPTTLKNLRSGTCECPIIMSTSKNSMENITTALSLGANEYMMKPFTKDVILEKIDLVAG